MIFFFSFSVSKYFVLGWKNFNPHSKCLWTLWNGSNSRLQQKSLFCHSKRGGDDSNYQWILICHILLVKTFNFLHWNKKYRYWKQSYWCLNVSIWCIYVIKPMKHNSRLSSLQITIKFWNSNLLAINQKEVPNLLYIQLRVTVLKVNWWPKIFPNFLDVHKSAKAGVIVNDHAC